MRFITSVVFLAIAMSCKAHPRPMKKNQMLVEKYFKDHVPKANDVLGSCASQLEFDENPLRIPQKIARITCHPKSGRHCVQVNLPMEVAYIRKNVKNRIKIHLKDVEHRETIQVPSGCYSSELPRRS